MDKIIKRHSISIIPLLLFYFASVVMAIAEFYSYPHFTNLTFAICFITLQLLSAYTFIALTPTYFLSKLGIIVPLLTLAVSYAVSETIFAISYMRLLIEICIIFASLLLNLYAFHGNRRRLCKTAVNNYTMMEYNIYSTHQMNLENCGFVLAILIIVFMSNVSATFFAAIVMCAVLIFMNYRRLFEQHLSISKWWIYLIEILGIVLSFVSALFGNAYVADEMTLFIIAMLFLLPHLITTFLVWKELRGYMTRFR